MGIQITNKRDFPSDPVHKTSLSNTGNMDSIPAWGAKIQYALWPKNQNKTKQNKKKQKQYFNRFNKDIKNGPH